MTQGENVNPYPRKQKKGKEGKFPIKEKAKKEKKENSQSKSGRKQKEKKEIPNQRMGERKKAPDQGSKENRRNVQKGLWTGQYQNNTELSPNERKERKGNHDLKVVFSHHSQKKHEKCIKK